MADDETRDRRHEMALLRYQMISPYLAMSPPRGQRRVMLEHLASKPWHDPDGVPMTVSAETLRAWVRRYRGGGVDALRDKTRPARGTLALTAEQVHLILSLKHEVPERSLDQLIRIAESMQLAPPGVLRRSTVHRVLQRAGMSGRPKSQSDRKDLDRFEALAPNDLWQSDMLNGPWLVDPATGKTRRAKFYGFLDDHSRLLLHGRFAFAEALPHLELVMRRSLQKRGVPRRVYFDNGKVYRAGHMRHIVAELGVAPIVYTEAYRPEGHGKIEAFNRLLRSSFIAELAASGVTTLDELNEAFLAWADHDYNRRVHTEIGCTPLERWTAGADTIRYADEAKLRRAFRWKEHRTPDKSGLFSLLGVRYQAGAELAKKRITVYFDPEVLDEVEVHHEGAFVERVRPFEVQEHRRPKAKTKSDDETVATTRTAGAATPAADYLGFLVEKRRAEFIAEHPTRSARSVSEVDIATDPEALDEAVRVERDSAILALLREHLDADAFDDDTARELLRRYGPFELDFAERVLGRTLERERPDHHVGLYIEALRAAREEGRS
jgi:transposase InsO family protein